MSEHVGILREMRQVYDNHLLFINLSEKNEDKWLSLFFGELYLAECYVRLQQRDLAFKHIKALRVLLKYSL